MLQPTSFQVTPDQIAGMLSTVKWIVGGALTGAGLIIGWLVALAFKMGGHVAQLKDVAKDMTEIKTNADKVPVLETRIATIENVVGRHNSDIKGLLRGSNPAFNGEGE